MIRRRLAVAVALSLCAGAAGAVDVKGVELGSTLAQARNVITLTGCAAEIKGEQECTAMEMYAGRYADFSVTALRGVVGNISIFGDNENWPAIRRGLVAKYGKPTVASSAPVTMRMGAVLPSESMRWDFPSAVIDARMHIDATHYAIHASSRAYLAAKAKDAPVPGKDM